MFRYLVMDYQDLNSKIIDKWNENDWECGRPITHEQYINALKGVYELYVTPTRKIPHSWIGNIKNKKVLALAAGGAQQCPVLVALGAKVTLLDYSDSQLEKDQEFAKKEGYEINIIKADMSKRLPFNDNEFDMIINPVSNQYIEDVYSLFKECNRVLKKDGVLICGLDNGLNYVFDDDKEAVAKFKLPFNPLKDEATYNFCLYSDIGIQFSHTIEDQIGGQLKAGFILKDLYDDFNGYGNLNDLKVPTFVATLAIKN